MATTRSVRPVTGPSPDIQPLEIRDIPRLRLTPGARAQDIEDALIAWPGRSVWSPDTLEYVLIAPWRRRMDISVIQEIDAVQSAEGLVRAAIDRSETRGDRLVLMLDMDEERPAGFYRRAGLEHLESIITYDLLRRAAREWSPDKLTFVRADPAQPEHLAALMSIDNRAFPWLWWNSSEEFYAYDTAPGVQICIGLEDNVPRSYFGVTSYLGWGHLDRIAVDPAVQGAGFGRETLAFAIHTLLARGANRVALSTQAVNARSRRLYERMGFRRSPAQDYNLFGASFGVSAEELVRADGSLD